VDEVELLGWLREGQPRASCGDAGQEEDVALDDCRCVHAGKGSAPQQPYQLRRAAHHHHRFRAQHRSQPAAGARDDRVHAARLGVEEDIAAGDERADVRPAGAREGVAQRVLRHEALAPDVHGPQQRDVALAVRRRRAPRALRA
jgi:hypothetical protein